MQTWRQGRQEHTRRQLSPLKSLRPLGLIIPWVIQVKVHNRAVELYPLPLLLCNSVLKLPSLGPGVSFCGGWKIKIAKRMCLVSTHSSCRDWGTLGFTVDNQQYWRTAPVKPEPQKIYSPHLFCILEKCRRESKNKLHDEPVA